jgi:hypothetical protein
MKIPSFNAEMSVYNSSSQYNAIQSKRWLVSQITPQQGRCVMRVMPELCLFIPFPFCLMPQKDCSHLS